MLWFEKYEPVVKSGSVAVWLLAAAGMDCTWFITCAPATIEEAFDEIRPSNSQRGRGGS